MPDPIVADSKKIPDTILPQTYLYDIPTVAGEEIELTANSTSSIAGIIDNNTIATESDEASQPVRHKSQQRLQRHRDKERQKYMNR